MNRHSDPSSRLRGIVFAFLFLLVLQPAAAAAQAPSAQGRTVEEVRVVGNQRIDAETIRFYVSTRVGAPFDEATAQLDYTSLLNTNFFRNLAMRWIDGPAGGVIVIIEVDEKPLLRQIRIEGTEKVDVQDFTERLQTMDRVIEVDAPVDEQVLRESIDVLTFMLQGEGGLQFVQVDLELQPSQLGAGQDAVYRVIEGDEVRIAQVMFEGNTVYSQKELRWALKRTNENYILSFLNKNDRFSEAGFESDMFTLRNMYFRLGYLDFNWGEPQVSAFTESGGLFSGEKQRLAVTIPISEGAQYHIGAIAVEGNSHFETAELLRLTGLREGDIFNVEQVQAGQNAISALYTDAGYFQVAVVPFPDPDPEARISNLTYRVQENAVYRVNRVEFVGNTHTRDKVLRRSMNLHELARWDQSRFNTSVERLYQLGYFQNVEQELAAAQPGESLDPNIPADPDYGTVDVNLKVEEVGRNQINFGGGLSAIEGAFIQLGYTTRNLFGYGQTLSLYAQVGQLRQNIRLSFSDPYLFGKRLRFGADIFRDAIDYPDFEREGSGFSTRVGKPLDEREYMNAFLEYNYELIDVGDISPTLGGISSSIYYQLFLPEGQQTTSSLRPFLAWTNVDSPYLPAKGNRTYISYEYAGGPLGGTLDFWKAFVRTTWWVPTVSTGSGIIRTPKQIFAVNLRVDYAEPHGDLVLIPATERFFLGGSNSVRGTRIRSIGPTDANGNILGGVKGLQYNLEYIFALTPAVRVKAFHDAGQAWLEGQNMSLSELRKTAGMEFEVFAPVFNVPFRFFWAYNFDPLESFGEQRSTFEFAIGSTF